MKKIDKTNNNRLVMIFNEKLILRVSFQSNSCIAKLDNLVD